MTQIQMPEPITGLLQYATTDRPTDAGRVKILCVDARGEYPVVALIDGALQTFTKRGWCYSPGCRGLDLIPLQIAPPKPLECWVWAANGITSMASPQTPCARLMIEAAPIRAELARVTAERDEAVGLLRDMWQAVCGETGFASAVLNTSGFAYPWPAMDAADIATQTFLAKIGGAK